MSTEIEKAITTSIESHPESPASPLQVLPALTSDEYAHSQGLTIRQLEATVDPSELPHEDNCYFCDHPNPVKVMATWEEQKEDTLIRLPLPSYSCGNCEAVYTDPNLLKKHFSSIDSPALNTSE